jgi:hypothetical protein
VRLRRILAAMTCSITALALTACGGGGGGGGGGSSPQAAVYRGVFIDAPVSNLTYLAEPSGLTGITDSTGGFNYKSGDTVTFSALGIALGSAQPSTQGGGNSTITVQDLATGDNATVVAQLLSTLNSVAVGLGQSSTSNPVFTIPTGSSAQLAAIATDLGTSLSTVSTALSGGSLSSHVAAAGGSITPALDALANITQGANGAWLAGTIWKGVCTISTAGDCGEGYLYFRSDGVLHGFSPATSGGNGSLLSGSWAGASTGTGATFIGFGSGGASFSGTLSAGATTGSATLTGGGGGGTIALSMIQGSSATSGGVGGGWFISATSSNGATGTAAILVAPDGQLYGMTSGGQLMSGTWNAATGVGTGSFQCKQSPATTATFSLNLYDSPPSGTATCGSQQFTLSLSRQGKLTLKYNSSGGGTVVNSSILLNIAVNWPIQSSASVNSFPLLLQVLDSNQKVVASGIKTETNTLSPTYVTSTTDAISVPYSFIPSISGAASNYTYQVVVANGCTINSGASATITSDGAGSITQTLSPVQIDCAGTAASPPPPGGYNSLPVELTVYFTADPDNHGDHVNSFAFEMKVLDNGGNPVANITRSETNPSPTSAGPITDQFVLSYPAASGPSTAAGIGNSYLIPSSINGCIATPTSGQVPSSFTSVIEPLSVTVNCP